VNKVFLVSGNAGQGKTTIAKNLAVALRGFGFDVLLVDSDLRTPRLGHHVGTPLAGRTIQEVLLGVRKLEDAVYCCPSGLKLLLSSIGAVDVPHPSVLLPKLKAIADVIIVDVPTFDKKWYDTGCDLLLVTHSDFPSVLDIKKLSKFGKVHGIVVNQFHDDGLGLSGINIEKLISLPVFGVVPYEPCFREALHHGYSLVEFHPDLSAAVVLKQIAAKLMNLEYSSPVQPASLLAKLGLK